MLSMIPYGRQDISKDDIEAVVNVLMSPLLTQGPVVPRYERALASYCGAKHGVAFNSATSALHIACLALDCGPGDWVWTSPNTFVASANAALYCGANVDFVDIDPKSYNMSIECLTSKLAEAERAGCLPKVVIPVHFAGQPCNMPAIYKLSNKYGFKIIEDASHAVGASYTQHSNGADSHQGSLGRNIKVGSCAHSHISIFSFHPVKIITSGEGGMAMTNVPELAERMRRLRSHGITTDPSLMHERDKNEIWNYQQVELGFNYRMTDIHAALGLSQLNRLDYFIERRRSIAKKYDKALRGLPIITPWQEPTSASSYHLYPVRVDALWTNKTQKQAYEFLKNVGIDVNIHYIPVHRHPFYEFLGFRLGDFPVAENFHRQSITLPIFPTLSQQEHDHILTALSEFFGA